MYTVKILPDEEFEKLPYARVQTSFGLADPKINTAYVRYTASHDLNKYLIDHELEHLVEEVPTDEIDGIRYKSFGSFFQPIVSGLGSIAKPIARGISSVGKAIGGGIGKVFGGGGSPLNNFSTGDPNQLPPNAGISGLRGSSQTPFSVGPLYSQQNPATPISTSVGGSSGFKQMMQTFGSGGGTGVGAQIGQQASNPNFLTQAKDLFGQGKELFQQGKEIYDFGKGAFKALKGLRAPDNPESVDQLRAMAGGNELSQQAQGVLSGDLGREFQPMNEAEIQAALRQLEKDQLAAEDQVRELYRNVRPGNDPTTDTQFARDLADINDRYARAKSDLVANRTRDIQQNFDQNNLKRIELAKQFSDSELSILSQAASWDIDRIMDEFELDFQEAQAFKEQFGI